MSKSRDSIENLLFASALLGSVLIMSGPACAVPMQAVYEGTVFSSFDQNNLFEQGGGNSLDDKPFILTFFYGAGTPGAGRNTTSEYDEAYGGTSYEPDIVNPVFSAHIVIGGHTELISGVTFRYALNNDYGGSDVFGTHYIENRLDFATTSRNDSVHSRVQGISSEVPIDLDTPYVIAAALINSFGGFHHYDNNLGQYTDYTYGNLNLNSLTVTRVEAVPLPAALPLFAAGPGAMGFMGRRKKRNAVVAA